MGQRQPDSERGERVDRPRVATELRRFDLRSADVDERESRTVERGEMTAGVHRRHDRARRVDERAVRFDELREDRIAVEPHHNEPRAVPKRGRGARAGCDPNSGAIEDDTAPADARCVESRCRPLIEPDNKKLFAVGRDCGGRLMSGRVDVDRRRNRHIHRGEHGRCDQ